MSTDDKLQRLYEETQIDGTAMTKWEVDFIQDVFEQNYALSEAQAGVIDRLYGKMFN